MHAVTVTRTPRAVAVALLAGPRGPTSDFELSWQLAGAQPRAELMAQRQATAAVFALTIQPPQGFDAGKSRPRELVFVVDVSGSMIGTPLDTARAAIERALAGMRADDTFNVITFASAARSFEPRQRRQHRGQPAGARSSSSPRRGTPAAAARRCSPASPPRSTPRKDPERLRMVLFMTDGYIGNESQIFEALEAKRRDARLFALGVGSSVNRFLIAGLAPGRPRRRDHRRAPHESPKAVVDEFYESIDRPVLTDISIDWGGLDVEDIAPADCPTCSPASRWCSTAATAEALAGEVKVRGKLGGADVELPVTPRRRPPQRARRPRQHVGPQAHRRPQHYYPFTHTVGELTGEARRRSSSSR